LWIEFPIPGQVCDNLLNTQCPLDEGEEVLYRLGMPIPSITPNLDITVEVFLKNDNNDIVTCFGADITIRKN
jgi:hypothetical protein